MELGSFLSQLKIWAKQQADIRGVLLVGSHARGQAHAESDVDLVILTDRPAKYLDEISFAENFGQVARWQREDWGKVTSMRVWYEDGMEVEFGITTPAWAALPLDSGTQRVISDGVKIIFEREAAFDSLNRLSKSVAL